MGTLTYKATYGDWSGTMNINYTSSYNRSTNKTTITFSQCSAVYSSRADYSTTTDTNITVTAGDNTSSSGTATLKTSGYGTGGSVTFTGTPSPTSITVQHSSGAGSKTVSISASTTVAVRPYSGSSLVYAGGSGSTSFTSRTLYTLTKNAGTGSTITVNNTTTGATNLASGALVAYGEVLKITFGVSTGYNLGTHTVNSSTFTSGNTHTVSGNVSVVSTASVKSYSLSLTPDSGSTITVNRTSSPLKGASTGSISNGATIYYNDVLSISITANAGYLLMGGTLNGSDFTSGTHTVTSNVTVVSTSVVSVTYNLSIENDANAIVTVYRKFSNVGELGEIDSSVKLYDGDKLYFTVSTTDGYWIYDETISGNLNSVASDIVIIVYAQENPIGIDENSVRNYLTYLK